MYTITVIAILSLEDLAKSQNPLLSYVRQRERERERERERQYPVNVQCSVQYTLLLYLTLRRRIKSHLLFAGIIRSSPFSLR